MPTMETFKRATLLAERPEAVYAWHARPGALERLSPPWLPMRLVGREGDIRDGDRTTLQIGLGPLWVDWIAEHRDHIPGSRFRDVQVKGPFARWQHTHSFAPGESGGCLLEDRIEYELPLGYLGRAVAGRHVRRQLGRTFAYRHRTLSRDLSLHGRHRFDRPLRFAVSGASGLVGRALASTLASGGHEVVALQRSGGGRPAVWLPTLDWDPRGGSGPDLDGTDVVVHLAGENIARGRWTDERKRAIRDSRVLGTGLIARAAAAAVPRPRTLICASAIGYYGDRGEAAVDETSSPGEGFLTDVCREWEEAADPAREAGIRVVHVRIGIVLTPAGGALGRMLPPARVGLGGRLGGGAQWMSWISLDDLVGVVLHAAATEDVAGPLNAVAPGAVRNAVFARALGRVLERPTLLPVPAAALRATLGEMAEALLLSGARVLPRGLQDSGYEFHDPDLEPALRHMLGRFRGERAR